MNTATTTPANGAASANLPSQISDNLDTLDPEDALNALHQWFLTYVLHCIADGVPEEMHDSICALYIEMRATLERKKFAKSKNRA